MNGIFDLLNPDNTVTVNRPLVLALGLYEAVIYSALIAKHNYYEEHRMLTEDSWFYCTIDDLEESTSLSKKQQRRCIDNLIAAGLIECRQKGMPAKRYFHISDDLELLESYIKQGEERARELNAKTNEELNADSCSQTEEQESPKTENKKCPNGTTCSAETAEHTYKSNDYIR